MYKITDCVQTELTINDNFDQYSKNTAIPRR